MEKTNLNFDLNKENIYLIPSYISCENRQKLMEAWKGLNLKDHVFILSSGTTQSNKIKSYAISKTAILSNALAVNEFLGIKESDSWVSSISHYHIGGLAIYARAQLSNSKVFNWDQSWDAKLFSSFLTKSSPSYFSLVPTQLYDLLQVDFSLPSEVKGIFIGGDFLSDTLKNKALQKNWPLIQTYGATELSSQIATSFSKDIIDNYLKVLPIHKITQKNSHFEIRSKSLYSYLIEVNGDSVQISKAQESFQLQDNLSLRQLPDGSEFLKPMGRLGNEIKVKGRLVNFFDLKNKFYSHLDSKNILYRADIQLKSDPRDGYHFILVIEKDLENMADPLVSFLNSVLGFSLVIEVLIRNKLEKTHSGKIKNI